MPALRPKHRRAVSARIRQPPGQRHHQADGGEFVIEKVVAHPAAEVGHLSHVDEDGGVGVEGVAEEDEAADDGGEQADDQQAHHAKAGVDRRGIILHHKISDRGADRSMRICCATAQ
jgi:hypothetical protein